MRQKLTLCAVFLAAASCLWGNKGNKLSDDLQKVDPQSTVKVIIRYVHAPDEPHFKRVSAKGGALNANLGIINSASFTVPATMLPSLETDPQISYVSLDRPVKPTLEYANPTVGANIAMDYGWTGKGVGVAVIDSGITLNPDLKDGKGKSRIIYAGSFVPGIPATTDQYGHGTHVAGIVGGNAAQSTGSKYTKTFRGIAPDVNIIDFRVMDADGYSSDSAVTAALDEAIRLKTQYNIRVLNLSLGRPVFESYTDDPLCRAVEAAWKAGIVVVVAAGNGGRNNDNGSNG